MESPSDDLGLEVDAAELKRGESRATNKRRRKLLDVERMFLAWIRTCISMLAVGYLLTSWSHLATGGRFAAIRDTGLVLVAMAGLLSAFATFTYWQNRRIVNQRS